MDSLNPHRRLVVCSHFLSKGVVHSVHGWPEIMIDTFDTLVGFHDRHCHTSLDKTSGNCRNADRL